jgi:hypothetical protein
MVDASRQGGNVGDERARLVEAIEELHITHAAVCSEVRRLSEQLRELDEEAGVDDNGVKYHIMRPVPDQHPANLVAVIVMLLARGAVPVIGFLDNKPSLCLLQVEDNYVVALDDAEEEAVRLALEASMDQLLDSYGDAAGD